MVRARSEIHKSTEKGKSDPGFTYDEFTLTAAELLRDPVASSNAEFIFTVGSLDHVSVVSFIQNLACIGLSVWRLGSGIHSTLSHMTGTGPLVLVGDGTPSFDRAIGKLANHLATTSIGYLRSRERHSEDTDIFENESKLALDEHVSAPITLNETERMLEFLDQTAHPLSVIIKLSIMGSFR